MERKMVRLPDVSQLTAIVSLIILSFLVMPLVSASDMASPDLFQVSGLEPDGVLGSYPSSFRLAPVTNLLTDTITINDHSGASVETRPDINHINSDKEHIPASLARGVHPDTTTGLVSITQHSSGSINMNGKEPGGRINVLTYDGTVNVSSDVPTISRVTPSSGVNTGPVNITNLSGSNFEAGAMVLLIRSGYSNITATDVVVVNQGSIMCVLPITGAAPGPWNVTVTNRDGQAGRKVSGFTVTAPSTRPAITRLTPSSGLNTASINITNLSGINFVDGSSITLTRTGYENISATDVLFVNSTFMTCVLPVTGAAPGPWNVTVTNPDGQAGRKTSGFTVTAPSTRPSIIRLTPSSGLNTTPVNITNLSGINFVDGSLITLTRTGYENISATDVCFVNSTFMTCVLPITGAAPGPWNVTVTSPDGQSGRKTSGFTVTTPSTRPSIIRLTPSSGLNTAQVNITNLSGINFVDGSLITLTRTGYENISATDVLFINSTFMTCVIPVTGAAPGPWNVTVTNPDGQAGRKTSGFTVTAPSTRPAITRLTPSSGLNTTPVNITNLSGINFVDGSLITLTRTGYENISATDILFVNSTFMTCVLPITGAAPGPWNVTVTNPDGQAAERPAGSRSLPHQPGLLSSVLLHLQG